MAVRQLQNLEYTWDNASYSLRPFAEQFSEFIKQKDNTLKDAEKIASDYIDAVYTAPETFIKQLKPENMSHARYFVLPDGSVYSKENPLFDSPEFTTQKGLYSIYERVLGEKRLAEYFRLFDPCIKEMDKQDPAFQELEKEVSASSVMQSMLEVNAEAINRQRNEAIASIAAFLRRNGDIPIFEKALLLKGAMTWGTVEKHTDGHSTKSLVKITDANNIQPVSFSGESTVAISHAIREGKKLKQAMEEVLNQKKGNTRSVPSDFTGWKKYRQSFSEADAVVLNKDAAGTGWCTGGALSTAQMHLRGGDFHIYFENGEPLIAIRTENGRMAEPPRGAHDGQFCTDREEQIAFEYITNGNQISAGEDYVNDILDIRRIMKPESTWRDAWDFPEQRRYMNGEFGGNLRAWGEGVSKRLHELLYGEKNVAERRGMGYFLAEERTPYKDRFGKYLFIGDNSLPSVKNLKGNIAIGSVKFKREEGSLDIHIIPDRNGRVFAPEMEKLEGGLFGYNGSLQAESLKEVTKFVSVFKDFDADMPRLASIGDYLSVREYAKINNESLKSVKGGIFVHQKASAILDGLEMVGERVDVHYGSRLIADNLKRVDDYIKVAPGAVLSAKQLSEVAISERTNAKKIFVRDGGILLAPNIGFTDNSNERDMSTLKGILGIDKTDAFGVEFSSSPASLRAEYKDWLRNHPGGIVAYRVYGDKSFTVGNVNQGIIGNPFNGAAGSIGEDEATLRFYTWLHTGQNFGEPNATEELRNAIINRLRSANENTAILYYRDIGRPSHATVLGYFMSHKDQLYDYDNSLQSDLQSERQVESEMERHENRSEEERIDEFKGEMRFLSNFYAAKVEFEGVLYPSAENAYQAAKCKRPEERAQFVNISAAEAKKLGKEVDLRDDWDDVKDSIMKAIVSDKFSRNSELAEKLIQTGKSVLVEGNTWHDTYWGVDLASGRGKNKLGEILMEVRTDIVHEETISNNINKSNMENESNTQQQVRKPIRLTMADGSWTRDQVAADVHRLYVFTDNTDRDSGSGIIHRDSEYYQKYGNGTDDLHFPKVTSAVIRGLDNAAPISTQRWYHAGAKGVAGRWKDFSADEFRKVISGEFAELRKKVMTGIYDEVVFPRGNETAEGARNIYDGLFNGEISAISQERVPVLYNILMEEYQSFAAFVNTLNENIEKTEQSKEIKEEKPSLSASDMSTIVEMDEISLYKFLQDMPFPNRGESEIFDRAADTLNEALKEGWSQRLPAEMSPHKYLIDLIMGLPAEVSAYIADKASSASLSQATFDEAQCDVYTIGYSTRRYEDFLSAIPMNTEVVIDSRNYPYNSYAPHFNKGQFDDELKKNKGITVEYLSEKDPDFASKVREIVEKHKGRVVIAGRGSNSASASSRGQLIGPTLEQVGITVGHITQAFDQETKTWKAAPRVMTQEELTVKMLSDRGLEITNGSFRNVVFNEDGSILRSDGVTFGKHERKETVDRRIKGNLNYNTPFKVFENKAKNPEDGIRMASSQADFTFVLTKNKKMYTASDKANIRAASNNVEVYFPEEFAQTRHELTDLVSVGQMTKEEMLDSLTAFVRRNVGLSSLKDRIGRYVAKEGAKDVEHFDAMHLTACFAGANIAELSTKKTEAKVTSDELSGQDIETFFAEMGGYEGGNSIIFESTDVSQEDVNEFCAILLRLVNEPDMKNEFSEGVDTKSFAVSKVIGVGETGAGLGGIIAGQQLYREGALDELPTVQPVEYYTIDDGTIRGQQVKDTVSFFNFFNQGYRNAPTTDELSLQASHVHELGQHKGNPGLTDRQVLVLSQLGFSNSDILIIVEQSFINQVSVAETPVEIADGLFMNSGAEGLLDLIQMCGGYGVESPAELTVESIRAAEQKADKLIAEDSAKGIGLLTVANPLYPDQFRSFAGFKTITEEEGYVVENGVASAGIIRNVTTEERPAILRFRGNIDALTVPMVAVVGNALSTEESKRAAANIGRTLGENDVNVVTPLRLTENTHHSVKILGAKTVLGQTSEEDMDLEKQEIKIRAARMDSASAARESAISAGATAIVISPNGLDHQPDEDQIRQVIHSGGIVLSEVPTGGKEGDEQMYRRAGYLSCALGGQAILVDGRASGLKNSPTDELAAAKNGFYVVQYPGPSGVRGSLAGNEELAKVGVNTVMPSGKGVEEIAIKAKSYSPAAALDEFVQKEQEEREKAIHDVEDKHVDHYPFIVVRCGTKQVFIVPENYPDVRDAVRQAYGENAQFSSSLSITRRNLQKRTREVDGTTVNTFEEYAGTQRMNEPVYEVPLFFSHGEIYSVSNAPRNADKFLRPLSMRLENKQRFDAIHSRISEIRRQMNRELGLPEDKTFRFLNADYIVQTQYSDELYSGNKMVAKVSLRSDGRLTVWYDEMTKGDLHNDFYSPDPTDEQDDVKREEADRLNGNRPKDEVFLDANRLNRVLNARQKEGKEEAVNELIERIENRILDKDGVGKNLSTAEKDIKEGAEKGYIYLHGATEFDRKTAFAAVSIEEAAVSKDIEDFKKKESGKQVELEDLRAKIKAGDNPVEQQDASNEYMQKLKVLDDKIDTVSDEISVITDKIHSLCERKAILQELKENIAVAEKISVVKTEGEGKAQKVTLCIDGFAATISTGKVGSKDVLQESAKEIEEIQKAAKQEADAFYEAVERIENHTITNKTFAEVMDRRAESTKYGKAEKNEIVPNSFQNGRYIIERDGKKAYADEQLNIRSNFYKHLQKWAGRRGLATNDQGKYNFIDYNGELSTDVWFDELCKSKDGVVVIKVDNKYGLIGAEGSLIGGRLFANAHESHDDWCLVKDFDKDGNPGKFNFINADGQFISDKWFDKAGDFENGKAAAILGKETLSITANGEISVISQGRSK